jgi:pSer/pThr/pTyr-binding forkhead associated (FHA) protein
MANEQLRVTEGEARGTCLSVDGALLIGRTSPDREGRLGDDPEISRRHASVSRGADGRLTIEDLGSANGTFVNDERIGTPRTLCLGDTVRVGKTLLQVTDTSGAVAKESPRFAGASAAHRGSVGAEDGEVLVVTAGPALGRRFVLTDELIIGRGVEGEGRLSDDPELSRRHARIVRDADGELRIEDLESANGTFVNDVLVQGRQVLQAGDSVRIGTTKLELTGVARAPRRGSSATPAVSPQALPAAGDAAHAAGAPPRHEPISALPLGSVLAGCRIEEAIGDGDMGIVYRAEEIALKRSVALKLILPEYSSDEGFRERFRRESKIAAAIDHPNVIPIFDAGEEDGVLFIMMRLVEGTDLRALIAADGPIEPLRASRIVRQVGAALDAAHARKMLHRDVKPSNVLLARGDHVYLSDFGLAKQEAGASGLTRHGFIAARAEYVAPEQVLNHPVDARADIYALGCLLFEAVTGQAPFAKQAGDVGLAHVHAPRLSALDLRPDLPRKFDDVIRRAMETNPSERYQSAGALGRAALDAAREVRPGSPRAAAANGELARRGNEQQDAAVLDAAPAAALPARTRTSQSEALRWAIALAGLVIVAVGMVAALKGISTL